MYRKRLESKKFIVVVSRIMSAYVCVSFLIFFCLVYIQTNFIMKNKDPHGPPLLTYRPYANGSISSSQILHYSFSFCQPLLDLHPDSFLFLSPFSLYKLDWGQMCVYLMTLSLKLCQLTFLYLRI